MTQSNHKSIEKIIDAIPSKTLKEAYKKDLKNGKYPNWSNDDLISLGLEIYNSFGQLNDCLWKLKNLFDGDIFLSDDIKRIISKIRDDDDVMTLSLDKYVDLKVLFKGGDLIRFKRKDGYYYGMVANYDWEDTKRRILESLGEGSPLKRKDGIGYDISDAQYTCFDLDNDAPNDEESAYACHFHVSVLMAESAKEDELCNMQKKYLRLLRENYLKRN